MTKETIYLYTDASFSKAHELAVIGYSQFAGSKAHDSEPLEKRLITCEQITERNNIRAEIRAALLALSSCPDGATVLLYSDCQNIIGLPSRREKLEKQKYISQSKGQVLANADLYIQFYQHLDRLNVELIWVKGHSRIKTRDRIQSIFSVLDKEVREKLRGRLCTLPIGR